MELIINGDKVVVPSTIESIKQLIEHYQLDKKVLIVEHNQAILEKTEHQGTMLCDGDKIEIVHFVGGG